jgi:hypothetical protein
VFNNGQKHLFVIEDNAVIKQKTVKFVAGIKSGHLKCGNMPALEKEWDEY